MGVQIWIRWVLCMDNVWNSSENDGLMEIHHPKQLYSSLRTIMLSFRCMMGAMICGPASPKIHRPFQQRKNVLWCLNWSQVFLILSWIKTMDTTFIFHAAVFLCSSFHLLIFAQIFTSMLLRMQKSSYGRFWLFHWSWSVFPCKIMVFFLHFSMLHVITSWKNNDSCQWKPLKHKNTVWPMFIQTTKFRNHQIWSSWAVFLLE